jgi:hypothetical protein
MVPVITKKFEKLADKTMFTKYILFLIVKLFPSARNSVVLFPYIRAKKAE